MVTHPPRKTRFRLLVRLYRTGLVTRRVPSERFQASDYPPFPSFFARGQTDLEVFVEKLLNRSDPEATDEPTPKDGDRASREKPPEAAPKPGSGADATPPPKQITDSIGMTLKLIPAGEFDMGLSDEQAELLLNQNQVIRERVTSMRRHHVRITRPFYMGATEVTRGQFRRFVESVGHRTESPGQGWIEERGHFERGPQYTWLNPGFPQTDDHPVVEVGWTDAVAFCSG